MTRVRLACVTLLSAAVVAVVGSLPVVAPPQPVEAAQPPAAPDYARDGFAFLQKYCVTCHGEKGRKADLSLHVFRDEASVIRGRKVWTNVLRMVRGGEMPPKNRPQPMQAEIDAFLRAAANVFVRADANAKPDPGRVTVRRLNRVEYDNTLRDLLSVDFSASEDFPSDDIGHGFDNIGDVLSISPVLMERYLAAAETVASRVIMPDPPKPSGRHLSSQYLEPAGPAVAGRRFRVVDKGNLNTAYDLTMGGEFFFRFRAYAVSKEAVKVSITVDGKEIKTLDIAATEKKPEVYEVKLEMDAGRHRVAVNMPKEKPAGELPSMVFVEYFALTGPTDTRPVGMRQLLAVGADLPKAERTRAVLTRFASRAYRRPATAAEIDRLTKLVAAAEASGQKWEAGLQLAVQAVLASPKFLFRLELDDRPDSADAHPIDEYQLASRLSYFLWSTMPDDELSALAGKKQLTANLDAQVRRMLADPKAKALVDNFAMQWLQLRRLKTVAPDGKLFPAFNDRLRASMLTETEMFLEAVIREDRSIRSLIDADFTFLNEPLARHYGIADTNGNRMYQKPDKPRGQQIPREKFVRVSVGGQRGGLLTQAGVLTVTGNPTRTSPVKRGKWVLEQLLGAPPPPPPPNVPELESDKRMLTGTLRQRMEQHRANPSCAGCHAKMDAIGFAFENYDAVGAWRVKDGDAPIDASGALPDGRSFKGAADLKAILLQEKEQFARCLAEKMLTYALGRGLEHFDKRTVDKIAGAAAAGDYKFSVLIAEIVKSDPFRLRRGREQDQQ